MTRHVLPALILASTLIAAEHQAQPARYYNPRFSTDASRVIFASTRDGKMTICAINADGSDARRVADFTGSVSWDGRRVTYSKITDGRSAIYVRDLTGGAEKELIGGESRRP